MNATDQAIIEIVKSQLPLLSVEAQVQLCADFGAELPVQQCVNVIRKLNDELLTFSYGCDRIEAGLSMVESDLDAEAEAATTGLGVIPTINHFARPLSPEAWGAAA